MPFSDLCPDFLSFCPQFIRLVSHEESSQIMQEMDDLWHSQSAFSATLALSISYICPSKRQTGWKLTYLTEFQFSFGGIWRLRTKMNEFNFSLSSHSWGLLPVFWPLLPIFIIICLEQQKLWATVMLTSCDFLSHFISKLLNLDVINALLNWTGCEGLTLSTASGAVCGRLGGTGGMRIRKRATVQRVMEGKKKSSGNIKY